MPGPQSKNLTTESFTLELSMPRSVLTVVVLFAGSYLSGHLTAFAVTSR